MRDGCLLFGQVPLVESDGMMLTQTRAVLSYLAAKDHVYGKDLKETVRINVYADGSLDLRRMMMIAQEEMEMEEEENVAFIMTKAKPKRWILKDHGEDFLVGNKVSWADRQLLDITILVVEELNASILSDFPLLKAFKTRISSIPTIKKFLQPGSQRKPPPDSRYLSGGGLQGALFSPSVSRSDPLGKGPAELCGAGSFQPPP
nr:LOW QUALITY PROTEIN: glutathione S-transferase alpha-4-like [Desmodus rotundus]